MADARLRNRAGEGMSAPTFSKQITLKSGGTVSVVATIDVFAIGEDERTLIFDLVDSLSAYEESRPTETEPE